MNSKLVKYISWGAFSVVLTILTFAGTKAWVISGEDIDDKLVAREAMAEKLATSDEMTQALTKTDFDSTRVAPLFEQAVRNRRAGHAFNNIAVPLSMTLTILVAIAAIGLAIFKLVQAPQKLIRFAIPAVSIIIILLIARGMASSDTAGIKTNQPLSEDELKGVVKNVGMLVNMTYILLIISVVSLGGAYAYNKVRK